MNKQELLDKAVHTLGGAWPSKHESCKYLINVTSKNIWQCSSSCFESICAKGEFEQRARELGYVNGYRWGVEYPTNGKKPDLPDDVAISWLDEYETWCGSVVGNLKWSKYHGGFIDIEKFKITDQRYKPADTSYLDAPKAEQAEPDGWFDYETQKALRLPPVGVECESFNLQIKKWIHVNTLCKNDNSRELGCVSIASDGHLGVLFWGYEFRPLDWNRKAEAEKKRVVEAVLQEANKHVGSHYYLVLEKLHDAGYLRLPADKS